MRKAILLLITLLSLSTVYGQSEPAAYVHAANTFRQFYNSNKPDSIYKIFGPEMRQTLTPEQFRTANEQLKTNLGTLTYIEFVNFNSPVATYKANFQKGALIMRLSLNSANQIVGLLLQPAQNPNATPASTVIDDPAVTETSFKHKTMWGDISGTLAVPKNFDGKIPVVLIIPGSGPTDRNGNNPMGISSNSYLLLAKELAKNNIASLRYDKRNIGQTLAPSKEKEMRFEDNSDDAIALIKLLHTDPRFSKIIVLGHSEGSLAGMLASEEQPVNAFISVDGAGSRADEILTEQMKTQPPYIANGFKTILDSLKKGKYTDMVDPALYPIARLSIQPYLLSWMANDPAKEIRKLKMPILIIQGTTDLQVNVSEAEKLKKAKSDAVLDIIPNMNHIMKDAPAEPDANLATYTQPNLPLKPQLVTDIVAFIGKLR
jgi:pimeloyl-ACP methyl ester carboxylesterase